MKRVTQIFLFSLIISLCVQCQKGTQTTPLSDSISYNYNPYLVTVTDIQNYIETRSGAERTKGDVDAIIEPVFYNGTLVFYLVNHKEGGWELFSSDYRAPRVIMKCETGKVNKDSLYFNETQRYYMENVSM